MADRIFHRHDTAVQARALLLDDTRVPITGLAGATVRYTLKEFFSGGLKINRATATIRDQSLYPGEVYYQFVAADVDTIGTYVEEWEITYADGLKETFPARVPQYVQIVADYDNV
jgi:hypothetical protein